MSIAELSRRFEVVDLVAVHHGLDAERRLLAGPGSRGLEPLALCVGDRSVTIVPGEPVTIVDGIAEGATCVVTFVDAAAFSDFFNELRTVPGAHLAGATRLERGDFGMFHGWEPALRALYQGRPVYDPATVDWDRIDTVFTAEDDPAAVGAFVREYGFAVVRSVFDADEIAAIDTAIARLAAESTPETFGTWWTVGSDGEPLVCQMKYTTMRAPEIAWIDTDERMTRLVEATYPGLESHPDRESGTFAVLKQAGATEGLTNLPWHIDCGLGGHTLMCPGLHIGIQLTASNERLGAFRVLPGSHESSVRWAGEIDGWRTVTVATEPGDITVHVPHALHAAPPPTADGPARRTLYLGFGRPEALELIGPGRAFDDLMSTTADDGFVRFDPDGTAGAAD